MTVFFVKSRNNRLNVVHCEKGDRNKYREDIYIYIYIYVPHKILPLSVIRALSIINFQKLPRD